MSLMEKIKFSAAKRQFKQKPNALRNAGILPANMYQAGKDSIALQIDSLGFMKMYRKLGENAIVYLEIEDEKCQFPVLVDEVSYDVYGKNMLHVVFRKVNLAEKIRAYVSVELTGEFEVDDAVLVLVKDSVEVEALPTDLPEKFELDQSKLQAVGDQVTLDSLEFDRDKVTLILAEDEKAEDVVLALAQEKAEEVEEEVSEELAEPELAGEKKEEAANGEAAADAAK
jgi:large subunit ribosomal protein L25